MSKTKKCTEKKYLMWLQGKKKQKLVLLSSSYQEFINGGTRLVNVTVIIVKPKHITPLLYFQIVDNNS